MVLVVVAVVAARTRSNVVVDVACSVRLATSFGWVGIGVTQSQCMVLSTCSAVLYQLAHVSPNLGASAG